MALLRSLGAFGQFAADARNAAKGRGIFGGILHLFAALLALSGKKYFFGVRVRPDMEADFNSI